MLVAHLLPAYLYSSWYIRAQFFTSYMYKFWIQKINLKALFLFLFIQGLAGNATQLFCTKEKQCRICSFDINGSHRRGLDVSCVPMYNLADIVVCIMLYKFTVFSYFYSKNNDLYHLLSSLLSSKRRKMKFLVLIIITFDTFNCLIIFCSANDYKLFNLNNYVHIGSSR